MSTRLRIVIVVCAVAYALGALITLVNLIAVARGALVWQPSFVGSTVLVIVVPVLVAWFVLGRRAQQRKRVQNRAAIEQLAPGAAVFGSIGLPEVKSQLNHLRATGTPALPPLDAKSTLLQVSLSATELIVWAGQPIARAITLPVSLLSAVRLTEVAYNRFAMTAFVVTLEWNGEALDLTLPLLEAELSGAALDDRATSLMASLTATIAR